MIDLEEVIIKNIINSRTLTLFILCYSQFSRFELIIALEYFKKM